MKNTIRTLGLACAIFMACISVSARDYYISSSQGADTNDGLTPGTSLQSFNLVNSTYLQPGDRVLLKRGDVWFQELNLSGKGNLQDKIKLTAYGSGNRPVISRYSLGYDFCVVINEGSYWEISHLDLRNAKLGIYLRYMQTNHNQDMIIRDCHFENMTDLTLDPTLHNMELAWSCGIWIGGQLDVNDSYQMNNAVLVGFTVQRCTFQDVITGVSNNWYHIPTNGFRARLANFLMEDCTMQGLSQNGIFAFNHASNGLIRGNRVRDGGGAASTTGITAAFLQFCNNVTIDDNEFSNYDRVGGADGTGMDFEGDCHNITFTNNVVHNNDGAAILYLPSQGPNSNITIADNTFYNNALDPFNGPNTEWDHEMHSGDGLGTGALLNNGIYRRVGPRDGRWLSPNWSNLTQSGNRFGYFEDVQNRPLVWNFAQDNNFEGWTWNSQVQWPGVGWHVIQGQAGGTDPYITSPPTWANSHRQEYLKIRMAVQQSDWLQVFFITETDPVWNGQKSVFVPLTPDSNFHDYVLDMRQLNTDYKGVITQIRLDPTYIQGDIFWIDTIAFSQLP